MPAWDFINKYNSCNPRMNLLYLSKKLERKKKREKIKPNNACRKMFGYVMDTSLCDIVNARGCTCATEVARNAFSRVLSHVTGVCYISTRTE